jgi:hypothetical protein
MSHAKHPSPSEQQEYEAFVRAATGKQKGGKQKQAPPKGKGSAAKSFNEKMGGKC